MEVLSPAEAFGNNVWQGWVQKHILNQIQIQLSQIKFKYIAFPDFNSNTKFQFKYKNIAIYYSNTIRKHCHLKINNSNMWPVFPL